MRKLALALEGPAGDLQDLPYYLDPHQATIPGWGRKLLQLSDTRVDIKIIIKGIPNTYNYAEVSVFPRLDEVSLALQVAEETEYILPDSSAQPGLPWVVQVGVLCASATIQTSVATDS